MPIYELKLPFATPHQQIDSYQIGTCPDIAPYGIDWTTGALEYEACSPKVKVKGDLSESSKVACVGEKAACA
jgi:hypothetical protein